MKISKIWDADYPGDIRVEQRFACVGMGLIPRYWSATTPNKLFAHMLLGLPVIVPDAVPTARIVETGCGRVFRDRDVDDLARCRAVLADTNRLKLEGEIGWADGHGQHNWPHDSRVLVETVAAVAHCVAST